MKVSSIYGKKVISTSGKEGYVLSVWAEGNKIKSLFCADANEKEFNVDFDCVKSVKDKIIYKDCKSAKKSGKSVTLGKPVFSCEGEYIGKVTDFIAEKNELVFAIVGNKKFSCEDIIVGDAVIIKSSARIVRSDVKKGNRVIIRRGTPLTPEVLEKAQKKGEYVQTNLKSI